MTQEVDMGACPPVLCHYMPWFQYDAAAQRGGWHWTMGQIKRLDAASRVASHVTPLIGPYDSRDPRVIRYHLRLMKRCGVRGIIINWYGTRKAKDFGTNLLASDAVVEECVREGMLFTLCYEDWTVIDGAKWGERPAEPDLEAALAQLHRDFEYVRDRYLSQPGFLREDEGGTAGRPLVLCFGPRILKLQEDWDAMLDQVFPAEADRPHVLPLHAAGPRGGGRWGRFCWFPKLNPEPSLDDVGAFLDRFYAAEAKHQRMSMGAAWPGFRDYYSEGSGGRQKSYGFLSEFEGRTFDTAMDKARQHRPSFVQVCTWNDWQEGTVVEPSKERAYYYCLKLQQHILGRPDEDALREVTDAYFAEAESG